MTGSLRKNILCPESGRLRVLAVFGTRPEAVKMAPLIKELKSRGKNERIDLSVCVTAQHREMLDQVLERFGIKPDYDLDIMRGRQTIGEITTRALNGLTEVIMKDGPDVVLVHGDTTTSFAGSLAAFYEKVPVGHVEAGLRTHDKYSPYPEEMNRRLTGALADVHFAPTSNNFENLISEGVRPEAIYITGNTVIDAIRMTASDSHTFKNTGLRDIDFSNGRVITVTLHRRENLGKPLEGICRSIRALAEKFGDIKVVYPVHLNPAVRDTVYSILGGVKRIMLVEPVDVVDMHNLLYRSYMVITDSGGLQEEAPSLGVPVIVARNETERPEAVKAGTVRLAGADGDKIFEIAACLLEDRGEHDRMAKAVNPYGDGRASARIADALLYEAGITAQRPDGFSAND